MVRLLLVVYILCFSGMSVAIEEPKYTLLKKIGVFELREYSPKIVAETFVSGSMDEASRTGFKLIADYIFGNNTSSDNGVSKVSMTAPVAIGSVAADTMEQGAMAQAGIEEVNAAPTKNASEKVSMTAPVTIRKSDAQWRVHFVMPREYTLESLPKPNNSAVILREEPASRYAVIRFSGFTGEKKVAKKTVELMVWLNSRSIVPTGKPELARYNPPWILPFFWRNEVMIAY